MNNTGIDWTEKTWNPVTGCSPVSAGCAHCYAKPLAERLRLMGNPRYRNGFKVTLHPDKLREPMREGKGAMIFVNSMSDLLHEGVPDQFIKEVLFTIRDAPQHTYQLLTKRAERWPSVAALLGYVPPNAWIGVSIESAKHLDRLEPLGLVKAAQKMVSFEPLLGPLGDVRELARTLHRCGITWVIDGGESGWKARPAQLDWFRTIRDACEYAGIAYFHKQHGGRGTTHAAKLGGDLAVLDGRLHHESPATYELR